MTTQVLRNTETHLIVKVMNEDTHTISLADGTHNTVVPTGYKIMGMFWSAQTTGGEHIEITRNSVNIMDLHSSGQFDFAGQHFNVDDEETSPIVVSRTAAGHDYMLIIKLRKII